MVCTGGEHGTCGMHAMPHLQHASLCTSACMLHTQGCAYMHMQGTAYTQEYTYCVRACAYCVRAPVCAQEYERKWSKCIVINGVLKLVFKPDNDEEGLQVDDSAD